MAADKCETDGFCIRIEATQNRIDFYGDNRKPYPITADVLLQMNNLEISKGQNLAQEVAPHSKTFLFQLASINRQQKWNYKYRYDTRRGSVSATHDAQVIYRLPYTTGERYRVGQSCNGPHTHNVPGSHFAIDFTLPEGTPVLAARAGKVVDLYEFSIIGGTSQLDYRFGNYVIVEHADRTMGAYFHLKTMGVSVELGREVKAGDLLGFSGNTGFSSGPHLHFVVQKPVSGAKMDSIPVMFATAGGSKRCPPSGAMLQAIDLR